MKRLLCFLLSCCFWLSFCLSPALAQESSADISDSLEVQVSRLSFDDLPAFENDGFMLGYRDVIFQAEGQEGLDSYDEQMEGFQDFYDPAREWLAGQFPSEVIKLGDLMFTGAGIEQLTLDSIGQMVGFNIQEFQLSDIPFLQDFTLSDLVGDVPYLGDYSLADMPNLAERIGGAGSEETLSQYLYNNPEIGQMSLSSEELGSLQVSDVPNLEATHLGEMPEVGDDVISNVPGLSMLQFGQYPGLEMIGGLIPIAKQDIAFGDTEYSGKGDKKATPKPVSGGTNGTETWEPIGCVGGCPHIELYDSDISPIKGAWAGGNWMTTKHRVRDGFGVLGALFDEAGAYRVPFGPTFAFQVRSTDEATGAAEWGIAFRVCKRSPIDLGCTAYFMEVPLPIQTFEGATILTGIKDGLGGSTQPIKAPEGWEDLRPDVPPELRGVVGSGRRRGGFSLCGEGPGGVNFQSLAAAFSSIEGDYDSVGTPTGGGVALGRYHQYMTYREDVRAIIRQKEGGEAFLRRSDAEIRPTSAEVEKYFPPDEQDSLFREDQTNNINQAISEGFSGSRIIERVGQIHYGGPDAPIDGNWRDTHKRLTLKTYGEELAETYHTVESSTESSTKCSAPTPVEPLQTHLTGTLSAQEYGAPRPGGRLHAGQDFDLGPNDTFQSYVGGQVVRVDYDEGGYYHYIDIYNSELDVVERIAELDNLMVQEGDMIQAGQVVGQGTQTTGVVHVEYRPPVGANNEGGFGYQGTYDPVEYLENLGVLRREGIQMIPIEHTEGDGHDR